MTPKSQQTLYKKYPKLFRVATEHGQIKPCRGFGIEVQNGWFNLVDETCAKLSKLDVPLTIFCIKQKWGVCTFQFWEGFPEIVWKIINQTEQLSKTICESCGTQTDLGTVYNVICKKCREEGRKSWSM